MVTSFARVFSIVCTWHLPVFVPGFACQYACLVLGPAYTAWHDKHRFNCYGCWYAGRSAAPDLGDLALGALNAQLGCFQLLLLPLLALSMFFLLQATCATESGLAREVQHAGPHMSRYLFGATVKSVKGKAYIACFSEPMPIKYSTATCRQDRRTFALCLSLPYCSDRTCLFLMPLVSCPTVAFSLSPSLFLFLLWSLADIFMLARPQLRKVAIALNGISDGQLNLWLQRGDHKALSSIKQAVPKLECSFLIHCLMPPATPYIAKA